MKHTEMKEKNTEENTKTDMDKKSKIQTGVPKVEDRENETEATV